MEEKDAWTLREIERGHPGVWPILYSSIDHVALIFIDHCHHTWLEFWDQPERTFFSYLSLCFSDQELAKSFTTQLCQFYLRAWHILLYSSFWSNCHFHSERRFWNRFAQFLFLRWNSIYWSYSIWKSILGLYKNGMTQFCWMCQNAEKIITQTNSIIILQI